jgi:hypothetical protein
VLFTVMRKNTSFILLSILIIFSCSVDTELDDYLSSCISGSSNNLDSNIELVRTELKRIGVSPEIYKAKVKYSLFEEEEDIYLLETDQESSNHTIYNLSKGIIQSSRIIEGPPIDIGITTYFGHDSIYFHTGLKGVIYRMDTAGTILEKIDIKKLQPNWFIEGSIPSILDNLNQGQIGLINDHTFLLNLDAFDFWLYPNKDSINSLIAYDFQKSEIVSEMGEQARELTSSPVSLPDKYTYPYYEIVNELIYVSNPFNHSVQVFDKDGTLLHEACMASEYIEKLQQPLDATYDMQEAMNFHVTAPYYGQLNYHEETDIFSRLVFHEAPLYRNDGKLNMNNCDKTYSLILFNKDLQKVSEIFLGDEALWVRALATKSGFIASGKCNNYVGEDYLRYNFKYDFK